MNLSKSPNLNHLWATLMIEELIRNEIFYFCLTSGSRSALLACAIAQHPQAKKLVHYDERGLAFHALGYMASQKRPAVILCTSGTAVANFFPAIIEANKKKLPLIILTADRPAELRSTGEMQTIDQVGIFGHYVRWHLDLPCPTIEIAPQFILTTIDQAIHRATSTTPGPVHLNCMMRDPLTPIATGENFAEYLKDLKIWQKSSRPYTEYLHFEQTCSDDHIDTLSAKINSIKQGVIVVGKLKSSDEQKSVIKLARKLAWPIFPDISSGLRLGNTHRQIIHYFDQILAHPDFPKYFPFDGVLHLGGRITSKRWYQLMKILKPTKYLMVLNHPFRHDPLHNVTTRIQMDITTFCEAILDSIHGQSHRRDLSKLQEASLLVHRIIQKSLVNPKNLNEPAVARLISDQIPKDNGLFLGNSMPIRDMDMYAVPNKNPVIMEGNRGASGIDGTIATAIGFCAGLRKPVTVLLGDLAFLHDLNSLSMHSQLNNPIIFVVINNNGAGIFSFLPIAQFGKLFEPYFGTPHNLHFELASQMFGLHYAQPQTPEQFIASYSMAYVRKTSTVIEVTTHRSDNFEIHQQLQANIIQALNPVLKS